MALSDKHLHQLSETLFTFVSEDFVSQVSTSREQDWFHGF